MALIKKGNPILKERCKWVITQFPADNDDEVYETIDLCKDALRGA